MIFREVRSANVRIIFLNGLMLLLIALFPFPTRTIGQFAGGDAEAVAVAFYAGYTGLISSSFLLLTLNLRASPGLLTHGDGHKAERPNIRELNKGNFKTYKTLQEIYAVLFSHT
jgi:uncharacterized membrane protein